MAIWVCGEALIDKITSGGQLREIPGGGPANTAHALARLDVASEFIGGLSSDSYGQMMREQFTAAGDNAKSQAGAASGDLESLKTAADPLRSELESVQADAQRQPAAIGGTADQLSGQRFGRLQKCHAKGI